MIKVNKKVMVSTCCIKVAETKKKLKAILTQISLNEADLPPDNWQASPFMSHNHSFTQQLSLISLVW